MNPLRLLQVPLAGMLALLMAGCGGTTVKSAEELNRSYELALARTEAAAVAWPAGGPAEMALPAPVRALFEDLEPGSARELVAAAYAPEAYLNDTLVAIEGAGPIGEYLARTAARVRSLRVEFLGVAQDGVEHYVRWRMTVAADRLNGGQPMVSYGVTHFRFDDSGRILVHKDFWDAGTGLYEYLPGVGGLLRRVRAAVEEQS